MDWFLVMILCLQWTATEPVCRKEETNKHRKRECQEAMDPTAAATVMQAEAMGAVVLFVSAVCSRSRAA
jgi:hypothetical protein